MQKYDTLFSCGNIYFGKNYPYFGFAEINQSGSCRYCKKQLGMSPQEYRKSLQPE